VKWQQEDDVPELERRIVVRLREVKGAQRRCHFWGIARLQQYPLWLEG
jgi:hypothetical protein